MNVYGNRKIRINPGVTKKIILSLVAILLTIHNISAQEKSNTIVVPPDPEDLVNGYALIEEISLDDYLLNLDKLEMDNLSRLPLEDLKNKIAVTIPELPEIDLSEFVLKEDLQIQDKIELSGKLKQLYELQQVVEQIYYAEYLSVNMDEYVIEAVKNREYQHYYTLLKIRSDLKRIIYSASISSRDLIDGIHYKIPMDYPVEVPKSIRIQLMDKRVRYSELKRLKRTISEIGSSYNWSPLKDQKLKSDVLLKEVEKLQDIKTSLLIQFSNVSQPLPETIQKEVKDYKIFSGIQETLRNPDSSINIPEIEAELSELKGTQYYPVALNSITEMILNSNGSVEVINLEKNLLGVIAKFPSLFETQRSLLLLGKIELAKTRPDLNMAIDLLAKAADFPSTKYLDEAVYEYAKASFLSDDDLKIRNATEKLILLIRGYAYDEPNADRLQKTAVLYLKNLIEKNGSRFAQNKDEIHNTLFVPENQNFNEAIEVIYLETLFLTYPDNPDVNEIIKRFEVASGLNPKLELLKIKAGENLSGDMKEGYARRVLLLEKMDQLGGENPYLNIQLLRETLNFQIFELAVYLSQDTPRYYENAMRQAENYLTRFPDSPNAFTVANNRSELAFLTSDTRGKRLESFRLSLETLNYTNDPGQKIGITDRIISRLLKNGYDVEDISDENLYEIVSGKVKYPAGNQQSLAILTKALLIYKDVSEILHRDQKLIPVVASDFADKGFYKSSSFLYQQYIQKNPAGSFVEQSLDGFFLVNMKQENYDELTGLVDFISHSDDFSPDLKNKAIQYHNELDILLAKQMSLNGGRKESEKILEQALAENPDIRTGAAALFELAIRAEEEGRLQDAMDYFLTLADIHPESNLQPEALQNFAYLLERKKKNDAGFSPITPEDIGYAFLKAARAELPDEKKNTLYARAVEYLRYGNETDAIQEALEGFYSTNIDSSKAGFALDLYASILWQKRDYSKLKKILESANNKTSQSLSSQFSFYDFLIAVESGEINRVDSIIKKTTDSSLKNTMTSVRLEVQNQNLYLSFGDSRPLSLEDHKKLKQQFESALGQYKPLLQDETVSTILYDLMLAEYEKQLADRLKGKGVTPGGSTLQNTDTGERLNQVITHFENVLNRLSRAENKILLLQAVFDTMVVKTGKTKGFYWDFLGIYSAEILQQYPLYSEQKLLTDLKTEIEAKKKIIISRTLDVLHELIHHFLSVRSPGRDEMSVIYYDYSVLNDLVLPRFEITAELYRVLDDNGQKLPGQINGFVELYAKIIGRTNNQQNRLFLNMYEPAVSQLIEQIGQGKQLSRNEIDHLLDLQELMADYSVNSMAYTKAIMSFNHHDNFLEETLERTMGKSLETTLEQVRRFARISNNLSRIIGELEEDSRYMVEDLITGSSDTELRILQNMWLFLDKSRSVSNGFRQSCLLELVIREPSEYSHLFGIEGKEVFISSSEELYEINSSLNTGSEWKTGSECNKFSDEKELPKYFTIEDGKDTATYKFKHTFPFVPDNIVLEVVSGCEYELYVNSRFAAEGGPIGNAGPDQWDIGDLILIGEENSFQIQLLNPGENGQVAWRLKYESYDELGVLYEMFNKSN